MPTYSCDHCEQPFRAKTADRNRGWARYCSKSCKMLHQRGSKKKAPKRARAPNHSWSVWEDLKLIDLWRKGVIAKNIEHEMGLSENAIRTRIDNLIKWGRIEPRAPRTGQGRRTRRHTDVMVSFNETDWALIRPVARSLNVTPSAYIRNLVRAEVNRLQSQTTPSAPTSPQSQEPHRGPSQ